MHGVVILAIFGFCLVLAHAVAARRPLVAVLAVVAGAGWAATLYPSRSIVFGAVILAGALWALAGLRSTSRHGAARRGGAHSRGGGGVDLACGREGRRPRVGALESEWLVRRGDLGQLCLGRAVRRHQFSKKERTVLRITGPKRGLYWRATTLDQFDSDRWLDNPIPLSTGLANGRLPTTRSCRRARSTRAPG